MNYYNTATANNNFGPGRNILDSTSRLFTPITTVSCSSTAESDDDFLEQRRSFPDSETLESWSFGSTSFYWTPLAKHKHSSLASSYGTSSSKILSNDPCWLNCSWPGASVASIGSISRPAIGRPSNQSFQVMSQVQCQSIDKTAIDMGTEEGELRKDVG
jgi:hypothetical protein